MHSLPSEESLSTGGLSYQMSENLEVRCSNRVFMFAIANIVSEHGVQNYVKCHYCQNCQKPLFGVHPCFNPVIIQLVGTQSKIRQFVKSDWKMFDADNVLT